MANFTITGKKNPGDLITAAGDAPVVGTDTLTVHGYTKTVSEAIRRGLVRTTSVSGNTSIFQIQTNPDKFNQ